MNKQITNKKNGAGFTLIELILYISVASLVILGVSAFFSVEKKIEVKNKSISAVEEEGAAVADIISQKLSEAAGVCTPATSGEQSDSLVLDSDCVSHTSDEVTFSLDDNNQLLMSQGGGASISERAGEGIALTDSRVSIRSISFTNTTDTEGGPAEVDFTFEMRSKSYSSTEEYSYSKPFSGGATIKKTASDTFVGHFVPGGINLN